MVGCASAPETFDRKADADRALSLVEAQMMRGEWADPTRSKVTASRLCGGLDRPAARAAASHRRTLRLAAQATSRRTWATRTLGKLTTQMIRDWRAKLLARGVSVTMAAKAYRLLRAILTTAVEEDKILPRNPCRVRGAGSEHAPNAQS